MKYIEYEVGRDTFSHEIPEHLLSYEQEYILFRISLETGMISLSEIELKELEADHRHIRDLFLKKGITNIRVVEQLF